jgi:hypothetical protein
LLLQMAYDSLYAINILLCCCWHVFPCQHLLLFVTLACR